MPEVGVLNLTIQDNSTEAAGGLSELTGALVGLQNALGQGLKLSGVSKPLNTFANAVKENSKTFANVGTFLNAMSTYKKAFDEADKVRFNAQPIRDLKDAIGDGIRLGQAGTQIKNIREALTGEWNTDNAYKAGQALAAIGEGAKSIPSGLEKKAISISNVASALQEYADASERIRDVVGFGNAVSVISEPLEKAKQDVVDYRQIVDEMKDLQEETKVSFNEPLIPLNLQFHSGEITSGMQQFEETVHSATDEVKDFNVELRETRDVLESIKVNPFADMYQSFSQLAHEFDWFKKESLRLTSGDSPLLLGDGRTPGQLLLGDGTDPQTFLVVWKDTGEQWKQNWVYFASETAEAMRAQFKPDWIFGGQPVAQSMSMFHLGAGIPQLLLGDGGVSPENMLSSWIDTSEQWKQNWIVGEGTVSEIAEDVEKVSSATTNAISEADKYREKFEEIINAKAREYALTSKIREQQEAMFYSGSKKTVGTNSILDLDQTNKMADNLTQLDLLKAQLREAESEYNKLVNEMGSGASKAIKAGLKVQELRDAIYEYTDALREANEEQRKTIGFGDAMKNEWGNIKDGATRLIKPLRDLVKRFGAIAKYRMLRSIIRHITSGFSEGVQNVYQYSKAIGGSFATSMDSAATALQQMKNSIGAALAPAIQAVIPYLNTLVNWFIQAVNWANQLFAMLAGQSSWTRALPETSSAFEKQTKSAKGAGKAIKDLLADWDELNIIQSESGGGGSGAGKTAEEYKNMFEEVNEFSEGVKNAIEFIDEHLGGIPELLKKAAAILLGWKFSKAFKGILGQLGSIIAGLGAIQIGFELAYGAGFDAGKKGYFDASDVLKSIGGVIATALGGYLIGRAIAGPMGGTTGLVIGLGIGVAGIISGWIAGKNDALDESKWGGLHRTKEEIEEFVKSQFTFDADAEINVMKAHIKDTDDAKKKVRETMDEFKTSLTEAEELVMQVNTSTAQEKVAAVKMAAEDASAAIKALNKLIDTNEKGITYTLTNFKFTGENGEDITNDLLDSIKISDTTLREYFTGMGQSLAKLMLDGEKSGWKNGEMEAALELMASQKRIYDRASELQEKMKFETQAKVGLKNVIDRETAIATYKEQQQQLEEYENTVREMVSKEADNLTYLAALAESAAIEAGYDPETGLGSEAAEKLHNAAEAYKANAIAILSDLQGAVDDKLADTKAVMAEGWKNVLVTVYGEDMLKNAGSIFDQGGSWFDWLDRLFGVSIASDAMIERWIEESGYAGAGAKMYEMLLSSMENIDQNGILKFAIEELGLNLWDLLTEDMRTAMVSSMTKNVKSREGTYEILKAMFGLDDETAKKYIDLGYQNIFTEAKETVENEKPASVKVPVEITAKEEGNPLSFLDIFGLRYAPPEVPNVQELLPDPIERQEVDIPVGVKVNAEVVNIDDVYSDIRQQILDSNLTNKTEALGQLVDLHNHGDLDVMQMLENSIKEFGIFKAFDYLRNYLEGEEWGVGGKNGIGVPKITGVAAPAIPATTGPFLNGSETVKTEPADPSKDAANVAAGVRSGNIDLLATMRSVEDYLRRLNGKEWSVNVYPTSVWGFHGKASDDAYEKVTGNV